MRETALATLLVVSALAGCLGSTGPEDPSSTPESNEDSTRLHVGEPLTPQAVGREPAVAQIGPQTMIVAAAASDAEDYTGPLAWRSEDGGKTFEPLNLGQPFEGANGNNDVDLAVGPEGTVYLAAMVWSPTPSPLFVGAASAITVGTSTDGGDSWRWTTPVRGPAVDRPWVEVTPEGTAHLVWNDAQGIHHATSEDEGATWSQGPMVHDEGGAGSLVASGDLLAVRVVPPNAHGYNWDPGADGVAVSHDQGGSWSFHDLPGDRAWHASYVDTIENRGIDRFWEPLALGANSTLYAAWKEGSSVVVARSTDAAETWELEDAVDNRSGISFPWLDSGGLAGEIALTWFEQANGSVSAKLAEVSWGPQGLESNEFTLAEDANGTWGEYLALEARVDGTAWTAVPVGEGDGPLLHFAETRQE